MDCRKIQAQLSMRADDSATVSNEIQTHLEHCHDCRVYAEDIEKLNQLLWLDTDSSVRPGFDNRFFARLEAIRQKKQPVRKLFSHAWAWFASAGAVAAIVMLMFYPFHTTQQPDPFSSDLVLAMHMDMLQDFELLKNMEQVESFEILTQIDPQTSLEQLLNEEKEQL